MVASKIVKGPELCTERVSFTDQTSLFYNAQETLLEKRNGLLLIRESGIRKGLKTLLISSKIPILLGEKQ